VLSKARLAQDGALVGDAWSGKTGHRSFRAERDPEISWSQAHRQ
jgi:hypothetical protein